MTRGSRLGAPPLRPAWVCGRLLCALDASEGRRRRRKRDTTPDAIGMGIKRRLLEEAVRDDPAPGDFESWLWERSPSGPVQAMALTILSEWQLARSSAAFRGWLDDGAPSADTA